MNEYKPVYYPKFKCTADRCRHSCCRLWDIELDENTVQLYGDNYPEIFESVDTEEEQGCIYHSFKQKDRSCVHLQDNGFCSLICKHGENIIPENCANHPRFYNFLEDRIEYGLGICCEEACRLILDNTEPFELLLNTEKDIHDVVDVPEYESDRKSDPDHEIFLLQDEQGRSLRTKYIDIFNCSSFSLNRCFEKAKFDFISADECFGVLSPLERLDGDWTDYLEYLKENPEGEDISEFDYILKNLAVYFLYRYVFYATSGMEEEYLYFVNFSVCAVMDVAKGIKHKTGILDKSVLLDICRAYSAEIEYSTENTALILESAYGGEKQ